MSIFAAVAALCAGGAAAAQEGGAFASYQAHIAAAEKSLRLGEATELRRWLDGAPPEFRGWEWRYLDSVSDTSARSVAAPATPIRVAISTAGDRLATVEGSAVRLWSWPSMEPLSAIEGHTDAVYRAEFDATGTRMITVARDVTSRVWDIPTGAEVSRIDLSNPAVAAATFSPDGSLAATCAWERDEAGVHGVVWIWDPATGAVREKRRVGVKPLSCIRYTPDGERLLVGSWDGLVHVLTPEGEETLRITMPDENVYNAVNDIAVSPDGALVIAGTKDRTASVFRIGTGELVATLRGHQGYIEGVMFSADGARLATASGDATVRVWRAAEWSCESVLRGHQGTVRGVVFAGRDLVTCSLDGTVREWAGTGMHAEQVEIEAGVEGTYSATLSPDGATMAVACHDGTLRMFDAGTGAPGDSWMAHPGSTCHAAAYSADGSRLITCSWDKTARVWQEPSHEPLATLEAGGGVYAATLSPDGARAATTGGELLLWTVDDQRAVHRIGFGEASSQRAAFSPDGSRVASGWTDGSARVHDALSGVLVATLECGSGSVETVAFSADGRQVITGDSAGVVRLHGASDGVEVWECDTGDRAVNQVAMQGDRVAAGTDGLVLIDAVRGGVVLQRRPLSDGVWHLAWSSDGARIGVCATNGSAAVLGGRGRGK